MHSKRAAEDSNGPVSFTAYEMNGDLDRKAQCVRISISYLTLSLGAEGEGVKNENFSTAFGLNTQKTRMVCLADGSKV